VEQPVNQAIGQVLALAVAVGLSPIPIVGVVLMLATPRARSNGPAFIAGWIAGLATLGTIILLVASGAEAGAGGQPAEWANLLKLALGAALLTMTLKQWRGRPRAGETAKLPSWMRSVDHFTAGRSAGLGVALAAVNPKNLVLVVGAATTIAQTGTAAGKQAIALTVFVLVGSVGTGVPVALYLAMGERSKPALDELKSWMARNSNTIMAVLCLAIGAKLIGDGISGF
jgi:threonine/homoserine/homoserine lactone efflux protein